MILWCGKDKKNSQALPLPWDHWIWEENLTSPCRSSDDPGREVDKPPPPEEDVYKMVFKSLTKVEKQGQSCSGPWRWLRTAPMYEARKLLPSLCLEMTATFLCPVGITKRTDPRSLNFLCVIQGNLSPQIWLFFMLYIPWPIKNLSTEVKGSLAFLLNFLYLSNSAIIPRYVFGLPPRKIIALAIESTRDPDPL